MYIHIVYTILFLIIFYNQYKQRKMTADVNAALATFKGDLTTLLTNVSTKLQNIATAPTTDPDTVTALNELDKQVTDFNATLNPAAPAV